MGSDRTQHAAIPGGVWALGFVSMLMDLSSGMIQALLPIYLTVALGASPAAIGAIEGAAAFTASFVKLFSGVISDWWGRRKTLAVLGYGLAAFSKLLFPLATGLGAIVAGRLLDRIGKGIRAAPRDALVADLSPPEIRGACYGLRQTLDTVGAFLGPLIAILLMLALAEDVVTVFWVAVLPGLAAVAVLIFAVREPDAPQRRASGASPRFRKAQLAGLGGGFWRVAAIAAVFTLARFSEAFLVLRAHALGLPLALAPAVLVAMNLFYSFSAYPAGVLSDRLGRRAPLLIGLLLLLAADLTLALSTDLVGFAAGVALWGLHMGFSQGVLTSLVADEAAAELRGTAFGVFNFVTGLALLAANALAGWLWTVHGAEAAFLAAGACAGCAALGMLALPGAGKAVRSG